jgi:hypothetical protein
VDVGGGFTANEPPMESVNKDGTKRHEMPQKHAILQGFVLIRFVADDTAKWAKVVKAANLSVE